MILYNVTIGIDTDLESVWLDWMIKSHIPKVMNTGFFLSYEIYKVLSHDDEGTSYSVQYRAESMDKLDAYLNGPAPDLINEHMEQFRNRHVAFRSVLEKVG